MANRFIYLLTLIVISFRLLANDIELKKVSILTCGPGSNIYELEGHTALRLQFTDGTDLTVNWGIFDFNSPNFLYRFVKGETDYRMGIYPFSNFYNQYKYDGRELSERELYLTKEQKDRLCELIDSTITKGSPIYRYNYIKDNCATRPVDYIEKAIGSPITFGNITGLPESAKTFRQDMYYYHRQHPWYQFGIDLALGSDIDYILDHREHYFAPIALDNMLENASYTDSIGKQVRLAGPSQTLLTSAQKESTTPFFLKPIFISWLFFCITCIVCLYDIKRKKITLWFSSLYYFATGLAGLLLTFLIFISVHEATNPNWLYLWLNPFCFIGVIFIWLKKFNEIVFYWQIANFVALTVLLIIYAVNVQQLNHAFIPLIASDILLSVLWLISSR